MNPDFSFSLQQKQQQKKHTHRKNQHKKNGDETIARVDPVEVEWDELAPDLVELVGGGAEALELHVGGDRHPAQRCDSRGFERTGGDMSDEERSASVVCVRGKCKRGFLIGRRGIPSRRPHAVTECSGMCRGRDGVRGIPDTWRAGDGDGRYRRRLTFGCGRRHRRRRDRRRTERRELLQVCC